MTPDRSDTFFPHAAFTAAHLASLYGLRRIADVGLTWTPELALRYPNVRVTGIAVPGLPGQVVPGYAFGRPIDLANSNAAARLSRLDPEATAMYVAGPSTQLCGPDGVLNQLTGLLAASPLIVVATDDDAAVNAEFERRGLHSNLVGATQRGEDGDRSGRLIIADRILARVRETAGPAPAAFRAVAILIVYNEQDVIGPTIQKLVDDGVGVYIIDNWSTDRTPEIVRQFEGKGLVGMERFPAEPSEVFPFVALLRRVADLAVELKADWYIHADADERRSSPWPGVSLRDAFWLVDRAGFNAIDHTVINYRPIDNGFQPGTDYERHFRYFEMGRTGDLLMQVNTWKNVGPVNLDRWAGHQAVFPGRRVFPYKFLVKHYPIRSQEHGEQKVFRERGARWDKRERARGWHIQYDKVRPRQSFLCDPAELIEDRGELLRAAFLGEFISGAGLATSRMPRWAAGGAARRQIFVLSRPITRSRPYQVLRRVALAPIKRARKDR